MFRTLPKLLLLTLLAIASVSAPGAAWAQDDAAEAAETERVVQLLAAGWAFLDAGALPRAEEAFTQAYELRVGKDWAEVYYALAAVWWERRNAMASYSWLNEAVEAKRNSWYWNGGEEGTWDRRILGRLRYIERNFTVIKLRMPGNAKPLPPLADPPPADPLLRSFADALAGQVVDGADAGAAVQWFFLPNGAWFVGGEEFVHEGGEMEPTRATSWELPVHRGPLAKKHEERATAIAEREAVAEEEAAAQLAARQAAWGAAASDKKERDPPPTPVADSSTNGSSRARRGGSSGTMVVSPEVVARPMEVDPDQRPIAHRLVSADTTREVSADVSDRWRGAGFHARYGVTCPNKDAQHEIDFPDSDFYVRIDDGGSLKVRGVSQLTEKLRGDWFVGDKGEMNVVDLWYDGRKLLVVINGVEFGPVSVRRGDPEEPVGRWVITLSDARAEIQHLWIEPWSGN